MNAVESLQIIVRRREDMAILELKGEVDASADAAVQAAFVEARAEKPERLLLHFGGVGYINSTGIAILVSLLAQARREQLPVLVCGLSEHYQEIFRITRLSDFLRIFSDEESALSSS